MKESNISQTEELFLVHIWYNIQTYTYRIN